MLFSQRLFLWVNIVYGIFFRIRSESVLRRMPHTFTFGTCVFMLFLLYTQDGALPIDVAKSEDIRILLRGGTLPPAPVTPPPAVSAN